MRYPNRRYGNPAEFQYYLMCQGDDYAAMARILRRDERTVRDWASGRRKMPWWVPELLRLKRDEAQRMYPLAGVPLAVVTHGAQLELRRPAQTKRPQITDLRLDDFDRPAPLISCGA
jgi:hypothetical protein